MAYVATQISNYERRKLIVDNVFEEVLTPLRDVHGVFRTIAKGTPATDEGDLREVVYVHEPPACYVDEVPDDQITGTFSDIGDGTFVASTAGERITDFKIGTWIIMNLSPDDYVAELIQQYFMPVLDLMMLDPRRGGNAKTTELERERHTMKALGDRLVHVAAWGVPFGWNRQ